MGACDGTTGQVLHDTAVAYWWHTAVPRSDMIHAHASHEAAACTSLVGVKTGVRAGVEGGEPDPSGHARAALAKACDSEG